MQIINGYDLFEIRHFLETTAYQELELTYGYQIPPLLKTFDQTFKWKALDHDELTLFFCSYLKMGNVEFHARSLDKMMRFSASGNDDQILDDKLLYFATGHRDIYIGTIGEQQDKILLDDSGELITIADNVFSFFQGISANLIQTARSKEEYVRFKRQLGYDEAGLQYEGKQWSKYNQRYG